MTQEDSANRGTHKQEEQWLQEGRLAMKKGLDREIALCQNSKTYLDQELIRKST